MNNKTNARELAELRQRVAELEEALRERETEAALLHAAPVGIHECDTEGRITFVNASQEKITGYTADELVGTYIWDRLAPGIGRESLVAYFRHLVSVQPPPIPFVGKNIRKNGEVFDARVDWNYKRDAQGRVTGFVSIVSDISEIKRAEEALRKSERTLRTLIDASPESVLLLDAKGTIVVANETVAHRLRATVDELIGRTPILLQPNGIFSRRRSSSSKFYHEGIPTFTKRNIEEKTVRSSPWNCEHFSSKMTRTILPRCGR
jgi:PAS domain S-box-containing protein